MKQLSQSEQCMLWDSLRSGDYTALAQLYNLLATDLKRYGYTLIQDEAVVEDCLRELFLHLHKNRQQLEPTDNIRFYLFQGLRQRLLDAESQFDMGNLKSQFPNKTGRQIGLRADAENHVFSRVVKRIYNLMAFTLTRLQTGKRSPVP